VLWDGLEGFRNTFCLTRMKISTFAFLVYCRRYSDCKMRIFTY